MEERRQQIRRADDHCDNHEQNTQDISAIKTKLNTAQWLIAVSMGLVLLMLQVSINKLDTIEQAIGNGKERIAGMERDIDHLHSRISAIETRHANIDSK